MFKHKNLAFLCLFVSLLGMSSALAQDSGFRANSAALQDVTERASFEFTNESMYRDQNKWIGKTISFQGKFTRYPHILNTNKPYEECSGTNANKEPIRVLVFFDAPLLVEPTTIMSEQGVTTTEMFRVFGIVQKCREVISRTGDVRVLPVIDLLVVYRADDQTFKYPVWVSPSLRN